MRAQTQKQMKINSSIFYTTWNKLSKKTTNENNKVNKSHNPPSPNIPRRNHQYTTKKHPLISQGDVRRCFLFSLTVSDNIIDVVKYLFKEILAYIYSST